MTVKQQKTIAVAMVAAFVIATLGWTLAIKPSLERRSASEASAAAASSEAQVLAGSLATLEAKRDAMPEAEKQMSALAKQFPTQYRQDEWILMLTAVASDAGVTLGSVSPGVPTNPGGATMTAATPAGTLDPATGLPAAATTAPVAESTVTINATGSTEQVARFVAGLEQMQRPLLIDSLQFGGGDSEEASVAITGKTFLSQPLEAPVEAPAE